MSGKERSIADPFISKCPEGSRGNMIRKEEAVFICAHLGFSVCIVIVDIISRLTRKSSTKRFREFKRQFIFSGKSIETYCFVFYF